MNGETVTGNQACEHAQDVSMKAMWAFCSHHFFKLSDRKQGNKTGEERVSPLKLKGSVLQFSY